VSSYNETGFVHAFASDLAQMPIGSRIIIFSPFLNEASIALWGPHFKNAITRGCKIDIYTRKPSRQQAFQFETDVDELVSLLESLGARVGFDTYLPGQKPMHHKVAFLRFPSGSGISTIIWHGSMNALGHYKSGELMDRIQSDELYRCKAELLKLAALEESLDGHIIVAQIETILRKKLKANCPTHQTPMVLKFSRNSKYPSFFLSCPNWKKGQCPTTDVSVDVLNEVFESAGIHCTKEGCHAPLQAYKGKKGVYLRCTDRHFVNLGI
jgi:hypothetical protein